MDHVVYVSKATKELDGLLSGGRSMLVRGSLGKKVPYGRVSEGDQLFFATGSGRNVVKAKAEVTSVFDSEKLSGIEPECLLAGGIHSGDRCGINPRRRDCGRSRQR